MPREARAGREGAAVTVGPTVNASLLSIGPVAGPGGRVRGVRESAIIGPAQLQYSCSSQDRHREGKP